MTHIDVIRARRYLRTGEAARVVGVSSTTLWRWARSRPGLAERDPSTGEWWWDPDVVAELARERAS